VARPNWEYIRIDVDLPDHEKLDGLSDKAFRTLIELWCWCGRHLTDGFVRDAKWKTFGTKAAREQVVEHRLADRVDGGYLMHDYLGHQRSREDVQRAKAQRAQAGRNSAAARTRARTAPLRLVEQNGNDSLNGPLNGLPVDNER
jgi:hypothetical protein